MELFTLGIIGIILGALVLYGINAWKHTLLWFLAWNIANRDQRIVVDPKPSFANGTISLGESIIESTKKGAFSLVGGGDSVSAVKKFNFQDKVSYVSTGGGAMLESLEGKKLPGIVALSN